MSKKKEPQKVSEESVKSEEVIETPDKTEKVNRKFVVVAKHGVNLRKDASLTSDIVKVLEEGTVITTDKHVGEWVQTAEGFVLNKDYILEEQ